MELPKYLNRTVDRLKQDAKKLSKEKNISHTQALDEIAQAFGANNWQDLLTKKREYNNRKIFSEFAIDYGVLIITQTGINKSIMDATAPLRSYFIEENYHNYETQSQGSDYKVRNTAFIITDKDKIETEVSLYRPETKKGDPRIWIYNLKQFVTSDDKLALVIYDGVLYAFNISKVDISQCREMLYEISQSDNKIAIELHEKLREIAKKGALKAECDGDTAIGRTIETALGIEINSSKDPDYKGIEIKSARKRGSRNRKNLFAQVPDWTISKLKSSGAIVDRYGYERDGDLRLYCTLSSKVYNSQGLALSIDIEDDKVFEIHHEDGDVVTWDGKTIRKRLLEKHKETFWVEADTFEKNGSEYFVLKSIIHTKNPLSSQIMQLIDEGVVTIDHLIKRKNLIGSAQEKGPIFKINPKLMELLFPEAVEYKL